MSDWISTLVWLVVVAAWYYMGRLDGAKKERKRAEKYVRLAGPIFRSLVIDGAERVVVTVEKTDVDTWTAHQVSTVVAGANDPTEGGAR